MLGVGGGAVRSGKVVGSIYFSLIEFFRPHYGPGIDSAPNRSEYQGYLPKVKARRVHNLTTFLCLLPEEFYFIFFFLLRATLY